ncbi:hypothetical protein DL93DRAFT_2072230 [Clavulina sp. PMI_390]|nr:hypothetical protein DL93DRAFT_2072230 [Clavulina sp. PMI_390]
MPRFWPTWGQSRWIILSSSQHLALGLRHPHMDDYNDIGVAFAFVAHGINTREPALKYSQGPRHVCRHW